MAIALSQCLLSGVKRTSTGGNPMSALTLTGSPAAGLAVTHNDTALSQRCGRVVNLRLEEAAHEAAGISHRSWCRVGVVKSSARPAGRVDCPRRRNRLTARRSCLAPAYAAFTDELPKLGFAEGRNLAIEYRRVEDGVPRAFAGVNEPAAWKADVLFANGPELALQAAAAARPPLPIVFLAVNFDPIARGYVQSLAQPGGNMTGIVARQLELTAKQIELLMERFPSARSLGRCGMSNLPTSLPQPSVKRSCDNWNCGRSGWKIRHTISLPRFVPWGRTACKC
jgi:hypothetical protein